MNRVDNICTISQQRQRKSIKNTQELVVLILNKLKPFLNGEVGMTLCVKTDRLRGPIGLLRVYVLKRFSFTASVLPTFRRHLKTFYFQSAYPVPAAHLA